MINIKKSADCCGCAVCEGACPKNCISMDVDKEGFYYPKINIDDCINCGACEQVCPILNSNIEIPIEQEGYIVQNKNQKVLRESTSGGAFTAIAKYIINKGGVVFGVELTKKFTARHIYVETEEELYRFRNSKYIQSLCTGEVHKQVKAFLEQGRYVCFSGTPCLIEGLKNYLKKDYLNLVTVDVVCRAVPSPMIFRKYIEYLEMKLTDKIKTMYFRDKYYGYKYSTMNVITGRNNGNYHEGVESDPWLRAFFSNICDRPSCHECHFKKRYRMSDFTIWDCFNAGRFSKELDNDRGATRILLHTKKAKMLFGEISTDFIYIKVNTDKIVDGVNEMKESVRPDKKRAAFFQDAIQMNGEQLFDKYFPNTLRVKAERMLRLLLIKLGIYSLAKKVFVRITHKY